MSEDLEVTYLEYEDIDAEAEAKKQAEAEEEKDYDEEEPEEGYTGKRVLPETEEEKKRRKNRFKKGLLIYVIILFVIILAALAALGYMLHNYQVDEDTKEAEQRAPQLAFEAWYSSMTAEDWAEYWMQAAPDTSETAASAASYMQTLFGASDITLCQGRDSTEETPVFSVRNSDSELARVTLGKTETEEGSEWNVTKLVLSIDTTGGSITVPSGCGVACNGIALDEASAVPAETLFTNEDLISTLENATSWVTYTVTDMLTEPEFTVTPVDGYALYTDEEGHSFLTMQDGHVYQNAADSFVRTYLKYYMEGDVNTAYNLAAALAYLYPGSKAYSDLSQTQNGVSWNYYHGDIEIETEIGDVIIWADNCISIDIAYDAVGTLTESTGEENEYSATMRVFYTQVNGHYYITNYETL